MRLSIWPYLLGVFGYTVADAFLQTWLTIFFVPPVERGAGLVDPQSFGNAFLAARVLEAVANPLVGFWAARSGRPWLFLALGAIVFGGVGMGLFWLPEFIQTGGGIGVWLFGLLPLMTVGQACFIVPYLGLIPTMAESPGKQVSLTNTQALLILVAVLVGQVLSGIALKYLGGRLPVTALFFVGGAVAVMVLCALSVRQLPTVAAGGLALKEMGTILLGNRGFRALVAMLFVFWLGFSMVRTGATYFVTVLLGQPKEAAATYLGILFATTLLSVLAARVLTPKLGKRQIMLVALVLFACLLPLLATIGQSVGGLSPTGWASLIFAALGLPLGILSAVQNPLVAEQAEQDSLPSGQGRAALFFGLQGFLIKVSYGLAAAQFGWLQATFGYTPAHPLGIQLVGPVAGMLALAAAGAFAFYPSGLDTLQPAKK
ncbi:MFS transporter [Gloeobacter kilaueensis]|uniref:MFS transporter n=1 Tax=Gloeobacter kilaueensis TaxID=1416614 RepID=UPI00040F4C80|nr:MFS transporter [Gloeobacter kilaueensis]